MTDQFTRWVQDAYMNADKYDEDLHSVAHFWISVFIKEVRRISSVIRDTEPSDCYWTGFALEERVRDFDLE